MNMPTLREQQASDAEITTESQAPSMTAPALLSWLSLQGVTLWCDGDRLRYRSPRTVLSPEIKAHLTEHKSAIMALLRRNAHPRADTFPLSVGQQALWFLHQTAAESAAYNIPFAARICSPLDRPAFRRALQRLYARHRSLRMTYAFHEGKPIQKLNDGLVFLEEIDATAWTAEDLLENVKERRDRPFDLERGPVLRAHLFERPAGEHIVLLVIHHIAVDFWSVTVLLDELGKLYASESGGLASSLPAIPEEYAEFVEWQSALLSGEEGERLWRYWQTQLAGDIPTLCLPTDRPRPPIQTFRGSRRTFLVDAATTLALRDLAHREGATLNALLLAAFQVLLLRHAGQEELVVGTLTAGRDDGRFANAVGYFVNPVALRARCPRGTTFRQFLEESRRVLLSAIEHQDYPFSRLIERLQPNRDPSRSPVFQAMFVLQRPPRLPEALPFSVGEAGMRMNLGGLELEFIALDQQVTRFDLDLMMTEVDRGISGYLQYNADLFGDDTVTRLKDHFQALLRSIVAHPDEQVARLPMLTEAETRTCSAAWTGPVAGIPFESVYDLFEAQAQRSPYAIAVKFDGESSSYAQLQERANRLSKRLQRAGVGRGDLVAIAVSRSPDMVVAVLAVLKSGAAYVPLDLTFPLARVNHILHDAGIAVLLHGREGPPERLEYAGKVMSVDADDPIVDEPTLEPPVVQSRGDELAYVIYTSGSTGSPKGVEVVHRAVVNLLISMRDRIGFCATDVLLAVTTLSFDIAALELLMPLTIGGSVAIARAEAVGDANLLEQVLVGSRATVMQATPATWQLLINAGWKGAAELTVLCGGEALSRELADGLLGRCKALWNLYGPTETTIWSLAAKVVPGSEPIELGAPLNNTQIHVLDDHLQLVPSGVTGELYIGGDGLARGYHKRPELTRERFVPNPFDLEGRSRLYRTGDLVRWRPNGAIEFLGRSDHQVKVRGFRIELGEIDVALGSHPAVRQVASILKDEGADKQIVSFVVLDKRGEDARPASEEAYGDQVKEWHAVWNETYGPIAGRSTKRFDITGWKSSYSGEAMSEAEMREWLEATVDDVLSWKPRSVLDIGCGAGLLLFELAHRCERYVGVDFSAEALHLIESQLTPREREIVVLREQSADDLGALEGERFDVVILNSVMQYFPSVAYATRALEVALRATRPGGVLLVGDVRSLPLLEAFHAGVAFHRTTDSRTAGDLRKVIQDSVAREKELVLSPQFFVTLCKCRPEVDCVEIVPRQGRHRNEMTKFRYQAIIRTKPATRRASETCASETGATDVKREWHSLDELRRWLSESKRQPWKLVNLPNERLAYENELLRLLRVSHPDDPVGPLRAELSRLRSEGMDPDDVRALGKELGYLVEIGWANHGSEGRFDATFVPKIVDSGEMPQGVGGARAVPPEEASELPLQGQEALPALANNPLEARRRPAPVPPDLRRHLRMVLPEYMVPAAIIALDAMPLTPNGKIDRRALQRVKGDAIGRNGPREPPGSKIELEIAAIWEEVLRVDRVGVNDNFFDVGGHSLLVVQVRDRIQSLLQRELPVTTLFQFPTIATLAQHLSGAERADGKEDPLRAKTRTTRVERIRDLRTHRAKLKE